MLRAVPALIVLLGLFATRASAQSALGQSFTGPTGPSTVLRRFTVDLTGIRGTSTGAPYTANLYALSGGALVGGSLFSQDLGTSVSGLALYPNLALTPGQSYALLVGGGSTPVDARFDANTYSGGSAYVCDLGLGCSSFGPNDLNGLLLGFGPATSDPRSMLGQSFTSPVGPNTLLQRLTIGATGILGSSTGAPYTANLYALSGGALVGGSLFSQVLGTSVSGLTLFPNVVLTPGGTYVVLVSGGNGSFYTNFDADRDASGSAYSCFDGSGCSAFGGNDLNGFDVQFGPATTVPEPGMSGLLATGLLALGAVLARSRRRTT